MKNETALIDYHTYRFTRLEAVKHLCVGLAYFFVMGMIFYQNTVYALVACSGVVLYLRDQKKKMILERQANLRAQFKEAMYGLASALSAGRSLEQAFTVSLNDLGILYEADADIVREWSLIVHRLNMNETIESVLLEFAERAGLEEIHNFVSVFVLAKRSGGDLVKIIRDTTKMINEKMDIQKEIDVLVTQKKYEQKLLSYIVPGMILFFSITSPTFLAPMYTTLVGRLLMTLALGMYLISGEIGKKIVNIEV